MKKIFLCMLAVLFAVSAYSQKMIMTGFKGNENDLKLEEGDYCVTQTRLLSKKYRLTSPDEDHQKYVVKVQDNRMYFMMFCDDEWIEIELTKFTDADFGINEYEWLKSMNSKKVMSYLKRDGIFYYKFRDRASGHDFFSLTKKGSRLIGVFETVEGGIEDAAVRERYIYVFEKQ
ncbi:MAG: hypothetical protein K6B17_07485 [Treponema sp.]|nr:hypothetical protein [Treponema sp.]